MAASCKDQTLQRPPASNGQQRSETSGSFYNFERQSSIPLSMPSPNTGNPLPSIPQPPPDDQPTPGNIPSAQHRFLTPTEWARVAHGIGAIREGEEHQVVHPTCWYWPPKGLPEGLYRDVVTQRTKYALGFQLLSAVHWLLMILQVMVGAALTALGSLPMREATPITSLAAVNTVGAGLLGLMHNSGLPDRYRMDKAQFVRVEDYIKGVLDTGVVGAQQKVEDVLSECYTRLANARATVLSNKPEVYSSPPTAAAPGKNNNTAVAWPEPVVGAQAGQK